MMCKRMMHLQVLDKNLKVLLVWLIIILVLMNKLLLKIRRRQDEQELPGQCTHHNNEIINSIDESTDGDDDPSKDPDHTRLMQRIQSLMSLTVLLRVWKSI
jgi:hypothetical protein